MIEFFQRALGVASQQFPQVPAGADVLPYLFAAYAVAWFGLMGYLVFLVRKNRTLTRSLEELKKSKKK